MDQIRIATFYKFVELHDVPKRRDVIWNNCCANHIKGTILIAQEGINGTIAGTSHHVEAVLTMLRSQDVLRDLEVKESVHDVSPFEKLKVRLREEIVSFREPVRAWMQSGTQVSPEEWNALLNDPDTIVIDTRNDYETALGTFRGAVAPRTKTFREFSRYVRNQPVLKRYKNVAMFCTGGIRCEKASAWMLDNGFHNVFQLKGGILKYLEEVPETESLWDGECFVFDNRISVTHDLRRGSYQDWSRSDFKKFLKTTKR